MPGSGRVRGFEAFSTGRNAGGRQAERDCQEDYHYQSDKSSPGLIAIADGHFLHSMPGLSPMAADFPPR